MCYLLTPKEIVLCVPSLSHSLSDSSCPLAYPLLLQPCIDSRSLLYCPTLTHSKRTLTDASMQTSTCMRLICSPGVWAQRGLTCALYTWLALILPWEWLMEGTSDREREMDGEREMLTDGQTNCAPDAGPPRPAPQDLCRRDRQLLPCHWESLIPTKFWRKVAPPCTFSQAVFYLPVPPCPPPRPKDAMRALKKRLSGNRNFREVMLTLTVRYGIDWLPS